MSENRYPYAWSQLSVIREGLRDELAVAQKRHSEQEGALEATRIVIHEIDLKLRELAELLGQRSEEG